jgi:hypothetical protein
MAGGILREGGGEGEASRGLWRPICSEKGGGGHACVDSRCVVVSPKQGGPVRENPRPLPALGELASFSVYCIVVWGAIVTAVSPSPPPLSDMVETLSGEQF